MRKETGIYICTGCGIGDAIDVPRLTTIAAQEYNVAAVEHSFLCGADGIQRITDDIDQNGLGRVVIAGCSNRVNSDAFTFGSIVVERVNLREQVAWSHLPNDEDTQMLAEDCLRMGIVRAQKTEVPESRAEDITKTVLVVGGGMAGLTAALNVAHAGYEAVIVEKDSSLGGWQAKLRGNQGNRSPSWWQQEPDVQEIINEIRETPGIRILTSAQIDRIDGQPGAFDVTVQQNGEERISLQIGSIVLATGWQPYDAERIESYGYGKHADVVTNTTMEEMARNKKILRPSDGEPPANVAFILCAGSRDENHLSYCSSVCCLTSLREAMLIRQQNPQTNVFIFYKDIRTPGLYEDFYRKAQEDPSIFFIRGDIASVTEESNGSLVIEAENTLVGDRIKVRAELVVLATGMVPGTAESEVLRLQYRQGPELPITKYRFPDSNYICFPYETQRTGIYVAGCARQPMDIQASMEDATGAAAKAVQSLELIANGAALHPRSGDLSYPSFFLQRCTQCKRCTEECPFGALDEDEKGTPKPNLNRCRRCGICLGACPERLISFQNYSIDQLSSMIKVINVPEDEDKLRILGFFCENDACVALDSAGIYRIVYDPSIRVIPLRCLGSMNVVLIADAISRGIDGVLLMGCKHGDDYQCHFIRGSELADKRMQNIKETLERLVIEPERVKLVQVSISDYDKIPLIIDEFADELRRIGPNPYKGF